MKFKFTNPDGETLKFQCTKKDAPKLMEALICHWEGEQVNFGFDRGVTWQEVAGSKHCDMAMLEFTNFCTGDLK